MSSAARAGQAEPLLSVCDLRVEFDVGGARLRAVDGVDLELRAGETLALVGESGCGKSTLARAIAGLVPARGGSVRLEGNELLGLSRRALRPHRRRMQMVFQDPDASLNPRMTVAGLVGEALALNEGLRGASLDARVCELLERVGLDPAMRARYPHGFSGGQCQRIGIARALAAGPHLLLCDEVTSALDVSIQAQILRLLAGLQRDFGLGILFITHDLAVVRHVADRVAVMYLGQIVEQRETAALFEAPAHPYTQGLLASVPRLDPVDPGAGPGDAPLRRPLGELPSPWEPPPGCRFHPRCSQAFGPCAARAPELLPVAAGESRCFLADAATQH